MRDLTPVEIDRFWSKVDRTGRHWLWTAGTRNGYGLFRYGTRRENHREYAHRIAWQLTYGAIPVGLHVLHQCDIRRCCLPDDLFLGTNLDNIADCVAKRRTHGRYKLSDGEVAIIRSLRGLVRQHDLAEHFGVSKNHISRIQRGVG